MRSTRRIMLAVVAVALTLFAITAVAAAVTKHQASKTKTVTLGPGKTTTIDVVYPHALQYANAKYSCKVKKLQLAKIPAGKTKPKLALVKILSKGSAIGGSVCRVKVANNNGAATAAVRIKVTAGTKWTT